MFMIIQVLYLKNTSQIATGRSEMHLVTRSKDLHPSILFSAILLNG
jgi:hypothetical protein